jgi:hypothetical protein
MLTDVLPDLGRMIEPARPFRGSARRDQLAREALLADQAKELLGNRLKYDIPDSKTLERHAQAFRQFQAWAKTFGYSALPAQGPIAATYLMALVAEGDGSRVQDAARAIEFFHDAFGHYLDDAYITAALVWATQWLTGAALLEDA